MKKRKQEKAARQVRYGKWMKNAALALAFLLIGAVIIISGVCAMGRSHLRREEMAAVQEESGRKEAEREKTASKKRDGIYNILCIGVDKEEIMSEVDDDGGSVGQADAIFILSLDTAAKEMRILAIPRDTMVMVQYFNGKVFLYSGSFEQIALQYAYGDGEENSCTLVKNRVQEIMGEIPIHGYVALNLSCISGINDAVGGVEVTMEEDYTLYNAAFTKGATVRLMGEQAKNYVQGRDIRNDGSAYERISRQKQYLQAFIEQGKRVVKKNWRLPFKLVDELEKDMQTDIDSAELCYLVSQGICCTFSGDSMYILPGQITGGTPYEEYNLEEEQVGLLLKRLFYDQSDTIKGD